MVMVWHDGHLILEGFRGYDRPEEDPNGVSPDGNNGDTYLRPTSFEPTYQQLLVQHKFLTGVLTRDEAEAALDSLAENSDL